MAKELPLLLRRAQVEQILGVTSRQITKFVESGMLQPVKRAGCWNFYKRDEVLELGGEKEK